MLVLDILDSYLQTERAKAMKAGKIVVYHSLDTEHWTPILPNDVPDWVKDPSVMGKLVKGDMAQSNGGGWYRAEKIEDAEVQIPEGPKIKRVQ